jgi:hypothetical protein
MDQKYTLADFFKTLSEEKAEPLHKDLPEPAIEEKVEFSDFFKVVAEGKTKSDFLNSTPKAKTQAESLSRNNEIDLSNINEEIFKEDLTEKYLGPWSGDTSVKVPDDPLTPLDQKFVTHDILQKHYKTYIERVQRQLSSLGGGGEVKLRMLDDVDRSSIADGLFLKYQASSNKFVFASQEHDEPQVSTTLVSSATYEISATDSYIGVNYAGQVEITLPSVDVANGRLVYIKDESGAAEANPITVLGNVDNDAGGFTLQINNGSITLIYREGWRIV